MALRDQPYIPLYVQDFLTDEKLNECSALAHGIYIKLMCLMHKSDKYGTILLEQKYKQSDKQINNFAIKLIKHLPFTTDEIVKGLNELLSEKVIYLDGDMICQKRMIKDNELSLKRADAGKKGGIKSQFAKAKTQASTENESEVETESKNGTIKIDFEVFWNLYNKKIERKHTQKKWDSLSVKAQEKIIDILPRYIIANHDLKYRKNPMTFLNRECWNDEIVNETPEGEKVTMPRGYPFNLID